MKRSQREARTGTTALIVAGIVLVVVMTACLIFFRSDVGPDVPQAAPTGPFSGKSMKAERQMEPVRAALNRPGSASVRAEAGRFRFEAHVEVTPLHLLANGGLVASILLSVPSIIRAARQPRIERNKPGRD